MFKLILTSRKLFVLSVLSLQLISVNTKSMEEFNDESPYSTVFFVDLNNHGLSQEALKTALTGYRKLKEKGMIQSSLVSIADMSQSSNSKRLYIIDVERRALVLQTYVSHGRNSGEEYATAFSNIPESFQSSIGFYLTGNEYQGKHGRALRLKGLEEGFNSKAESRAIVMHGASYVSEEFIRSNGRLGRSQGCPAIAEELVEPVINLLRDGSCFYIYFPDRKYMQASAILN